MVSEDLILGRFKEYRNGVPLNYRIQILTSDIIEDAINHMVTNFLTSEPMTTYDHLLEDEQSLKSYKCFWKKTMEAGESMVAIEEKEGDHKSNQIIGMNCLTVLYKNKPDNEIYEGKAYFKILTAMADMTKQGDLFNVYGVDKYLTGFGLSVHKEYHGYNIGYRLLQSREPLCKKLGVKVTGTVFSNKIAQYLAAKAGFDVIVQEDFKNVKINGELAYPDLSGCLNLMAIKYNY